MKDELNGDIVGLRAKIYSVKTKKKEMKKAKRVKKKMIKKTLAIKSTQIVCLKKENLFIPCRV